MKAGWAVKPLGEVATVSKRQGGSRPLPYVGLEDIGSGGTGIFLGSLDPQTDKSTTFEFEPTHVLYGRLRPYLNKVLLPDFVGHCSSEIFPIKPSAQLIRRFLFYWLTDQQTVGAINETCTGARMPRANVSELMTFPLPLPPLEEQQRIVAVLDEAFEGLTRARAHAEANLQNARELFDKRLTRAFIEVEGDANTSTTTVAEVANPRKGSIRTGPFGSQLLHSEFTESGIAVLGIDNAVKNEFRWSRYRFISPEKYADLRRYTVFPGDVIITIMGTCGRCAVVPDDIPTAINTKHLCCITLDQTKCLPDYLHCYFLHSPTALEYLAQNATGSVMDGLNMGLIKELPVRVPSLEHQARVVDMFQSAKADAAALELHYNTKLKSLDTLRQSLLQKAFAGELT